MKYEPLSKIFYKNNDAYEGAYLKRYENEYAYKYDFHIGEYQAFVGFNMEILNLVTAILQADKKLLLATRLVPPIALRQFTNKCLIDEIKLTNEIEGVHSTRKEISEIINDRTGKSERKRLHGLVKKYEMLLNREKIDLISCENIRKLYDEFVLTEINEDDPRNAPDGAMFRKDGVDVLSPSQKVIHKGVYPESRIIAAMTSALNSLNNDRTNYFVNIAVFHYMFGYIHPFYDGNGRMGRFISSYLLSQQLEPVVGFGLSYTVKQEIKKYYDMFKEANDYKNRGDLTPFVIGFLEIVRDSIENLCSTFGIRVQKLEFYKGKIEKFAGGNEQYKNIMFLLVQNALFADEGLSVQDITRIIDWGQSTVRARIKEIPEELITIELNGRIKLYSANLDGLNKF